MMMAQIIETEHMLDELLPKRRLETSPPAELRHAALQWSELVWYEASLLGAAVLSEEDIANGLSMLQNPVFICGVHRSGTTLVQGLLDSHPQLSVLPSEGTYYTNIDAKLNSMPQSDWAKYMGTEWLRRMANPINQPPYWLLGRSLIHQSPYVDFARYVQAWFNILPKAINTQWPHSAIILAYASVKGTLPSKYWVDKTPTNERFLQRIWAEFPKAKIIHVVRDPVATLTSRKAMEPGITLQNALKFLKTSYQVALAQSNDSRYFLLKYEDLCSNSESATQALTAFLQIENSPELTKATVAGLPAKANSSFEKDPSIGKILNAAEHQQQELLTISDKKVIAAYVGKEAEALGYQLPEADVLTQLYAKLRYDVLYRRGA